MIKRGARAERGAAGDFEVFEEVDEAGDGALAVAVATRDDDEIVVITAQGLKDCGTVGGGVGSDVPSAAVSRHGRLGDVVRLGGDDLPGCEEVLLVPCRALWTMEGEDDALTLLS